MDYFYVDLLEGRVIGEFEDAFYNGPWNIAEHNLGFSGYSPISQDKHSGLVGGSENNGVYIDNHAPFEDWIVGTMYKASESSIRWEFEHVTVWSLLTLVSISDHDSVPEPSSFILLGAGLAGLGFGCKLQRA